MGPVFTKLGSWDLGSLMESGYTSLKKKKKKKTTEPNTVYKISKRIPLPPSSGPVDFTSQRPPWLSLAWESMVVSMTLLNLVGQLREADEELVGISVELGDWCTQRILWHVQVRAGG